MLERQDPVYRGRLAPSPTGHLHLGHATTFALAQDRCRARSGTMTLRVDDLDRERCRPKYTAALIEDMRWLGLEWQEGPFCQTERLPAYRDAWKTLARAGLIYPCTCTRRDVESAGGAPHANDGEAIYPGTCRPAEPLPIDPETLPDVNWRFRAQASETVAFLDGCAGAPKFPRGRGFW